MDVENMYSGEELDNFLRKVLNDEYDSYNTEDVTEKDMARKLYDDEFIRLIKGSPTYRCGITDKGEIFLSKGGYSKIEKKRKNLKIRLKSFKIFRLNTLSIKRSVENIRYPQVYLEL